MALRERYGALVARIVGAGGLADPEAAEAEVWARVWAAYPEMAASAAAGAVHAWGAWLKLTARRVVIDERRRAATMRRVVGVRAVHVGCGEDGVEGRRGPVEVDEVVDATRWGDPEAAAERAELGEAIGRALRRLPAEEAVLVGRWASGEGDYEAGRSLGMAPAAVRAARERALARLRELVDGD
jgi:DNA-directed RNA polymerase specialized sigma24 family protein